MAKRSDGYTNVMDEGRDQARRFEELVSKARAENKTPEGKARVEGCMRWLDYCGVIRPAEPNIEGYWLWPGIKVAALRSGKATVKAG